MFFKNDNNFAESSNSSLSGFENNVSRTIAYVMNEVQKKVLTLQNIIQFEERDQVLPYEKQVLLTQQNTRLRLLRHLAEAMLIKAAPYRDFDESNPRHNVIMMRLAIASFGYGACSECSDLTIFKLLKCKITTPIHFIGIESSHNKAANHSFVILGNGVSLPTQTFQNADDLLHALQSLPKDCIIIDTFFNLVGKPDALPQYLIDVCRNMQFDTILCNEKTTLEKEDIKKIQTQTMNLIQLMSKKIHDPTEPLDILSATERDDLRQLRVYLKLMRNYQTFTCQSSKEHVIAIAQKVNYAQGNAGKKVAISDMRRSQISFHREWLKANQEAVKQIAVELNASLTQ